LAAGVLTVAGWPGVVEMGSGMVEEMRSGMVEEKEMAISGSGGGWQSADGCLLMRVRPSATASQMMEEALLL
jgi:hypothetical protein